MGVHPTELGLHIHNVCTEREGKETEERKKYKFLGFLMIGQG
jgi:hypothetical protein